MSRYSNRLQPALQTYYNVLFGSSTRDCHARRIYRRTIITRKASDAAENLQLYRVVRFFHVEEPNNSI